MMIRLVLVALLLLPVIEIAVGLQVAHAIGGGPTVLLVLAGVGVGVLVLRHEGMGALRDLRAAQQRLAAGPGRTVDESGAPVGPPGSGRSGADRLLVVLAGLALLLPGLVSDVLGLALLLPPVRAAVRAVARRIAQRRGWAAGAGTVQVVRAEAVDLTPPARRSGRTIEPPALEPPPVLRPPTVSPGPGHDEGPGPSGPEPSR